MPASLAKSLIFSLSAQARSLARRNGNAARIEMRLLPAGSGPESLGKAENIRPSNFVLFSPLPHMTPSSSPRPFSGLDREHRRREPGRVPTHTAASCHKAECDRTTAFALPILRAFCRFKQSFNSCVSPNVSSFPPACRSHAALFPAFPAAFVFYGLYGLISAVLLAHPSLPICGP